MSAQVLFLPPPWRTAWPRSPEHSEQLDRELAATQAASVNRPPRTRPIPVPQPEHHP